MRAVMRALHHQATAVVLDHMIVATGQTLSMAERGAV
jgi:DNA repair protein RadC